MTKQTAQGRCACGAAGIIRAAGLEPPLLGIIGNCCNYATKCCVRIV
jgi:hypothetical protein